MSDRETCLNCGKPRATEAEQQGWTPAREPDSLCWEEDSDGCARDPDVEPGKGVAFLLAKLDSVAAERDRLRSELAASSNYVADREVDPTCVWFKNGRRVSLQTEVKGGRIVRAWLEVGRAGTVELAAAEEADLLPEGGAS
jgi:hypothetical protein